MRNGEERGFEVYYAVLSEDATIGSTTYLRGDYIRLYAPSMDEAHTVFSIIFGIDRIELIFDGASSLVFVMRTLNNGVTDWARNIARNEVALNKVEGHGEGNS